MTLVELNMAAREVQKHVNSDPRVEATASRIRVAQNFIAERWPKETQRTRERIFSQFTAYENWSAGK